MKRKIRKAPPAVPVDEFACLGCGVTRAVISSALIPRTLGVGIFGTDLLMPICSACEADLGRMIHVLAVLLVPASDRRQREVETVLWRVNHAAVARLKQDLKLDRVELTLPALEREAREHSTAIRHLEEGARRPPELSAIVRAAVGGWLARLARRWVS